LVALLNLQLATSNTAKEVVANPSLLSLMDHLSIVSFIFTWDGICEAVTRMRAALRLPADGWPTRLSITEMFQITN
jgi:hypothetical protein